MQVEIETAEIQHLINLIARGCSHVGQELSQRGLDAAHQAAEMLEIGHRFTLKLLQAKAEIKPDAGHSDGA